MASQNDSMQQMAQVNKSASLLQKRSKKILLQGIVLKRALERIQKRKRRDAFLKKISRKRK